MKGSPQRRRGHRDSEAEERVRTVSDSLRSWSLTERSASGLDLSTDLSPSPRARRKCAISGPRDLRVRPESLG